MIIKLRFASSTKNYYLCAYQKQKYIIMKKFFTILMAVLCLVAFSVSDAEAKTRKKTNRSSLSKSISCNLEGDLSGVLLGEGWCRLVIKSNKGYIVDSSGKKYRVKVTKIQGHHMEVAVYADYQKGEHGWMSGTISINNGIIEEYYGNFDHWYGYESEFQFMDYTGD